MNKILFTIFILGLSSLVFASGMSDEEAVEKASMSYIEGFYEGDQEKLKSCLIPEMNKHGFLKKRGEDKYGSAGKMSFQAALDFAKNVKEKKQFPKADAPKKVEVLEVSNKIAITKITAWWGVDYMLLAKNDGKWMIRQIVWEGPTPTATPSDADKDAAKKAGLEYIEGFYEGDDAKLKNVFKPTMYKWGYSFDRKTKKYKKGKQMTYAKAFEFAKGVRAGEWKPKPGAIKKVEVLDVMNHIAAIKVTAVWGIDYILLSREGDKWMIDQVLWSGIPSS